MYTQSTAVRGALSPLAHAHEASTQTLAIYKELFNDADGTAAYLRSHRAALRAAYAAVTATLMLHDIPFIAAEAGIFVLLDLRAYLPQPTYRAEATLWKLIFDVCNVNLTPGHVMHVKDPGWFRLCFAAVPTPDAVEAVQRLARLLRKQTRT